MAITKLRTIPETLSLLKNKIIVSVQADEGEPFYPPEMIGVLCQSVYNGGARAFRLANPDNIRYIKKLFPDIPVIGITKPSKIPSNAKDLVYITPNFSDIE
ncbi:MAG: hypothetical protein K2X66_03405, partial [Cyanobacteria bacterium]|nr:hypothetical protein [Cyanobacteriota bacterium]